MVLVVILFSIPQAAALGQYSCRGPSVTQRQIRALVSAVTDEIYALDRNPHYMDLPAGGDSVLLYVNPKWCGRMVYAIYKLLPVGEVLRGAWYVGRSDSLMRLAIPSAPDFSPRQESALLTLYLTDRELATLKASWKHVWFRVDVTPDSLAVDSARARQVRRDSL